MDNQESLEFIRKYFDELFAKRNVFVLDLYLDKYYFGDNIGYPQTDRIQNSKESLTNLFRENPELALM